MFESVYKTSTKVHVRLEMLCVLITEILISQAILFCPFSMKKINIVRYSFCECGHLQAKQKNVLVY